MQDRMHTTASSETRSKTFLNMLIHSSRTVLLARIKNLKTHELLAK